MNESPESAQVPDSRIGVVTERMDPRVCDRGLDIAEHLFRYQYALPRAGGAVLDVACGVGYGSRMMFDRLHNVTSVDLSVNALKYARVNYAGPDYIQADVERLPFASQSFDTVTAFEIIEHIEQADKLLSEIHRVLKPSGRLFVSTPNPRNLWATLRHYLRGVPYAPKADMRNMFHLREYHHDEFVDLIQSYGFYIKSRVGQRLFLRPLEPYFVKLKLFKLYVYMAYFVPKYAYTVLVQAVKTDRT